MESTVPLLLIYLFFWQSKTGDFLIWGWVGAQRKHMETWFETLNWKKKKTFNEENEGKTNEEITSNGTNTYNKKGKKKNIAFPFFMQV